MKREELGLNAGRWTVRPRWLSAMPCERVNENAKAVWCLLADKVNDKLGVAWPSHEAIMFGLGLNRNSVKNGLNTLKAHGLVEWTRSSTSSYYRLYAPSVLVEADRQVTAMEKKATSEGTEHDYAGYAKVFRDAWGKWLKELEAANAGKIQPQKGDVRAA